MKVRSSITKILSKAARELNEVRKDAERSETWPLTAEAAFVGVSRVLSETRLRFKVGRFNAGGQDN